LMQVNKPALNTLLFDIALGDRIRLC